MEPVSGLIERLCRDAGLPAGTSARVRLTGAEPALPSSFRIGAVAQATIAASALAAAEVWRQRTGRTQDVAVDMRHAAIEFRSERYVRTDAPPAALWDKIAGLYRCRDGRWVRIHTNFSHHRDGVLSLLGCLYDRDAVAAAIGAWDGEAFETAAAERGLVVTLLRSPAEWAAHPQGRAVAALPLLDIVKIGEASPRPFAPRPTRPLSGVRVLDLTRIIAGPVAGRTLAAHGADVLAISSPALPSIAVLIPDVGRGKRPAFLDLATPSGREALHALADRTDIFLQGYRPGGLAAKGFAPEVLASRNPGIVVVELSAYGHVGPWAGRRGFDSLTQNANGINVAEAEAFEGTSNWSRPRELPCQALDHGAGFLLAFGAMAALARRAEVGGSWLVRTSLAQVGEWVKSLGRLQGGFDAPDPTFEDVRDVIDVTPSGFGLLRAVRHAGHLAETPPTYALPAVPLGHAAAAWL